MKNIFAKKLVDKVFEIVILIKSLFGFFEVLAGIIFAISGRLIINKLIIELTQQEISEDTKDFFANYLIRGANNFSSGVHAFAAIYLIFHGAVNIFLVVALSRNKLWAYHWAMVAFSAFVVYQIYRYFHTYSPLLLLLTIFDIFIILIILLEDRRRRAQKIKK